jgi:hypothetical protein
VAKESAGGRQSGYNGLELLHLTISFRDGRTFIEQPAGSNSTEQLLSIVNWRTEIRFLIICGNTRTLLRHKLDDNSVEPVAVTGIREPLPTIIDKGLGYHGRRTCEREES